jgi:YHS domain-containing protein
LKGIVIMTLRRISLVLTFLLMASVTILSGCGGTSSESENAQTGIDSVTTPGIPDANAATGSGESPDEHAHKPGAHGGIIVPIGADSYHAEAVIEKGGLLRLLMLGADESRIHEVETQTLKAYIKAEGAVDATAIELVAAPQDGDSADKTSQFTGQLPEAVVGSPIEVTIPNLRIGDERFRVGFSTNVAAHDESMPARVGNDEESKLYLTPGGKYTQADIAANGNVTASMKFKGVPVTHDNKPQPGERICPISLTKANPAFTWVIDGKPYQFCCPPCVDEFVKMAKERPDELKDPDAYIKQ